MHAPNASLLEVLLRSTDASGVGHSNFRQPPSPPAFLVEICEVPTDDEMNDSADESVSNDGMLEYLMCVLLDCLRN